VTSRVAGGAFGTTGYAAVRPKTLLSAPIPLPPLAEQRRIVARIEELAAKISEAGRLTESARISTDILGGAAAASLLPTLEPQPKKTLGDLVSIRGGGTPDKSNPLFWSGSIPWISPKDMKHRRLSDSIDHISENATRVSPAKLLPVGSVLVVVRGMILVHTVPVALLEAPATINQDIKALVPRPEITGTYLTAVLWALNRQLLELVEKSTHDTRKLQTDALLHFEIPVPPLRDQQRIVARLDDLQAKVDALRVLQEKTAAELDALMPSILAKAFRGDL
jgi:type I restriction enzyme S subunit